MSFRVIPLTGGHGPAGMKAPRGLRLNDASGKQCPVDPNSKSVISTFKFDDGDLIFVDFLYFLADRERLCSMSDRYWLADGRHSLTFGAVPLVRGFFNYA